MPRRLSPTDLARADRARANLLRFRRELGWTASVVAARANLPVDTYRQLERGTRRLTNASVILDLARATGHRLDDFYEADPPPHDPERLALVRAAVLPGAELDADLVAELEAAIAQIERKQRRRNAR